MSDDPWGDLRELSAQVERGEECRQFIDSKGHQILTALRHMVEFWGGKMDEAAEQENEQLTSLAMDQHVSWSRTLKDAEKVVDGE